MTDNCEFKWKRKGNQLSKDILEEAIGRLFFEGREVCYEEISYWVRGLTKEKWKSFISEMRDTSPSFVEFFVDNSKPKYPHNRILFQVERELRYIRFESSDSNADIARLSDRLSKIVSQKPNY